MKGILEFQIKRGIVDADDLDDDSADVIAKALELCGQSSFEEASQIILDSLSFEFDFSSMDCDPSDFLANTDAIDFECTANNTDVKVGTDGGALVITAAVKFDVELNGGKNSSEIQEWLDENGAWACGYLSGGWGYTGTDGDNVYLVELDGTMV